MCVARPKWWQGQALNTVEAARELECPTCSMQIAPQNSKYGSQCGTSRTHFSRHVSKYALYLILGVDWRETAAVQNSLPQFSQERHRKEHQKPHRLRGVIPTIALLFVAYKTVFRLSELPSETRIKLLRLSTRDLMSTPRVNPRRK